MSEKLDAEAELYEAAADELDTASAHCRTAAANDRERDVPRAAAHAWAAFGHVRLAEDAMAEQARRHAVEAHP